MIELTSLRGDGLLIHPRRIHLVAQSGPNSVVTLADGTRVVVAEAPAELARRVAAWEAQLVRDAAIDLTLADAARPAAPAEEPSPKPRLRLVR